MKCFVCKGRGYTELFNPDTGKVERKPCSKCAGKGRLK